MKTDVIPQSLVHQGFAECEEHVEQPGVVDDVDPEPPEVNFHISGTKSHLLNQRGKAPVRKLQRHLNSSSPRYLATFELS